MDSTSARVKSNLQRGRADRQDHYIDQCHLIEVGPCLLSNCVHLALISLGAAQRPDRSLLTTVRPRADLGVRGVDSNAALRKLPFANCPRPTELACSCSISAPLSRSLDPQPRTCTAEPLAGLVM